LTKAALLKSINFLLFFGLSLVLMYFAFKNVSISILAEGLHKANYSWLALSLSVGILAFLLRALRWRLLIEPLGYKPSVANAFHAVAIGYLVNFALPRAGEVSRCGILRKTEKIPFESLVGTVIVERTFDLVCLLILLASVFFIEVDVFGNFIYNLAVEPLNRKLVGLGGSYLPFVATLGLTSGLLLICYRYRHQLRKYRFIAKLFKLAKGVLMGIKTGFTMERRVEFVIYTLLIWSCYLIMTWVVFYTIPATSHLGIADALFILAVSSIGMTVPVQGGFGAFHIAVSLGLTLYGVSKEDGLLYATISHESQAIGTIIIGLISLTYIFVRKQKPVKATSHEQDQEH